MKILLITLILSITLLSGCSSTENSVDTDKNNNIKTEDKVSDDSEKDTKESNKKIHDNDEQLTKDEINERETVKKELENEDENSKSEGWYETCPNCGKKIWTTNGDWDCDCSISKDNGYTIVNCHYCGTPMSILTKNYDSIANYICDSCEREFKSGNAIGNYCYCGVCNAPLSDGNRNAAKINGIVGYYCNDCYNMAINLTNDLGGE